MDVSASGVDIVIDRSSAQPGMSSDDQRGGDSESDNHNLSCDGGKKRESLISESASESEVDSPRSESSPKKSKSNRHVSFSASPSVYPIDDLSEYNSYEPRSGICRSSSAYDRFRYFSGNDVITTAPSSRYHGVMQVPQICKVLNVQPQACIKSKAVLTMTPLANVQDAARWQLESYVPPGAGEPNDAGRLGTDHDHVRASSMFKTKIPGYAHDYSMEKTQPLCNISNTNKYNLEMPVDEIDGTESRIYLIKQRLGVNNSQVFANENVSCSPKRNIEGGYTAPQAGRRNSSTSDNNLYEADQYSATAFGCTVSPTFRESGISFIEKDQADIFPLSRRPGVGNTSPTKITTPASIIASKGAIAALAKAPKAKKVTVIHIPTRVKIGAPRIKSVDTGHKDDRFVLVAPKVVRPETANTPSLPPSLNFQTSENSEKKNDMICVDTVASKYVDIGKYSKTHEQKGIDGNSPHACRVEDFGDKDFTAIYEQASEVAADIGRAASPDSICISNTSSPSIDSIDTLLNKVHISFDESLNFDINAGSGISNDVSMESIQQLSFSEEAESKSNDVNKDNLSILKHEPEHVVKGIHKDVQSTIIEEGESDRDGEPDVTPTTAIDEPSVDNLQYCTESSTETNGNVSGGGNTSRPQFATQLSTQLISEATDATSSLTDDNEQNSVVVLPNDASTAQQGNEDSCAAVSGVIKDLNPVNTRLLFASTRNHNESLESNEGNSDQSFSEVFVEALSPSEVPSLCRSKLMDELQPSAHGLRETPSLLSGKQSVTQQLSEDDGSDGSFRSAVSPGEGPPDQNEPVVSAVKSSPQVNAITDSENRNENIKHIPDPPNLKSDEMVTEGLKTNAVIKDTAECVDPSSIEVYLDVHGKNGSSDKVEFKKLSLKSCMELAVGNLASTCLPVDALEHLVSCDAEKETLASPAVSADSATVPHPISPQDSDFDITRNLSLISSETLSEFEVSENSSSVVAESWTNLSEEINNDESDVATSDEPPVKKVSNIVNMFSDCDSRVKRTSEAKHLNRASTARKPVTVKLKSSIPIARAEGTDDLDDTNSGKTCANIPGNTNSLSKYKKQKTFSSRKALFEQLEKGNAAQSHVPKRSLVKESTKAKLILSETLVNSESTVDGSSLDSLEDSPKKGMRNDISKIHRQKIVISNSDSGRECPKTVLSTDSDVESISSSSLPLEPCFSILTSGADKDAKNKFRQSVRSKSQVPALKSTKSCTNRATKVCADEGSANSHDSKILSVHERSRYFKKSANERVHKSHTLVNPGESPRLTKRHAAKHAGDQHLTKAPEGSTTLCKVEHGSHVSRARKESGSQKDTIKDENIKCTTNYSDDTDKTSIKTDVAIAGGGALETCSKLVRGAAAATAHVDRAGFSASDTSVAEKIFYKSSREISLQKQITHGSTAVTDVQNVNRNKKSGSIATLGSLPEQHQVAVDFTAEKLNSFKQPSARFVKRIELKSFSSSELEDSISTTGSSRRATCASMQSSTSSATGESFTGSINETSDECELNELIKHLEKEHEELKLRSQATRRVKPGQAKGKKLPRVQKLISRFEKH